MTQVELYTCTFYLVPYILSWWHPLGPDLNSNPCDAAFYSADPYQDGFHNALPHRHIPATHLAAAVDEELWRLASSLFLPAASRRSV